MRRRLVTFGSTSRSLLQLLFVALALVAPMESSRADMIDWFTSLLEDESSAARDAARQGMAIPQNAIVTGPNETRIIELGRDLLKLYPRTVVTVEFSPGKETHIEIITGTIGAKVAPRKKRTFSVHTDYLIAAVKGTEFEVSVVEGAAAVSVTSGRVAVKAVGVIGGVDVTKGLTATAVRDGMGPQLGATPAGGASAAAATAAASASTGTNPGPEDEYEDERDTDDRDINRSAGPTSRSSGAKTDGDGPSNGGSGGGSEGGDGDSDGDSGGGDGGDDGDDD
jgi:FecR protein